MSRRIKVKLKDGRPITIGPVQPLVSPRETTGRGLAVTSESPEGFDYFAAEKRTSNPNYFEITEKDRGHVSLSKENPAYKKTIAQMSPEEKKKYDAFMEQKRKEKLYLDESENLAGHLEARVRDDFKKWSEEGHEVAKDVYDNIIKRDIKEENDITSKYPKKEGNIVDEKWIYSERLKKYVPISAFADDRYNQTKKSK